MSAKRSSKAGDASDGNQAAKLALLLILSGIIFFSIGFLVALLNPRVFHLQPEELKQSLDFARTAGGALLSAAAVPIGHAVMGRGN